MTNCDSECDCECECVCLKIYKAFATAEGSAYTNSGQLVTATASATATSTVNYEDAYNVALNNAKSIANQTAQNDANVINQSTLEPYKASATAQGSATANSGQVVTATASATASSTLSYNDAYQIALNNATSIANQTAQNDANIINQSFPRLVVLENLSAVNNEYNISDNTNYFYVKGSNGNSTNKTPTFFPLSATNFNVTVSAIDSKGNVYVGGSTAGTIKNVNGFSTKNGLFTGFNYVAMWNGSTWSSLGIGLNAAVSAIAIDSNDNVYFGGSFSATSDRSLTLNNIAKWTPGTLSWSALGSTTNGTTANGVNGTVSALAVDSSNNVYVGGSFNIINDGAFATNSTNNVVSNTTTIIFTSASSATLAVGMSVNIVGYPYSNLKINAVGSQTSITVSTSINIPTNTTIYFSNTSANNIAKWIPATSSWSVLGSATNGTTANGVNNTVTALAVDSSNNVYVGGSFNIINNGAFATNSTNNVVSNTTTITFTSASSATLAVGMSVNIVGYPYSNLRINTVVSQTSITVSTSITIPANTTIYFSNTSANNIAKWTPNTSTWSGLGSATNGTTANGVNDTVSALAVDSSDNVYAGGAFTIINDGLVTVSTTNTATSSSLTTISGLTTATVETLRVGMSVNIVGYPYSNLKILTIASTTSITVSISINIPANTTIYFSNTQANYIAKWTPLTSAWSVLGGTTTNGLSSTVYSISIDSSNNAYVGGKFTRLGDYFTSVNYIAKWTPSTSSWSTVGGQMNNINTVNGTLNGLPDTNALTTSSISINKSSGEIYAAVTVTNNGSGQNYVTATLYKLFSDYINANYNGVLVGQLYLNGQSVSVYTNNNNGNKICQVVSNNLLTQSYF